MALSKEDEEWEYIYDSTETETLTFTIDLSAAPLGPSAAITNPLYQQPPETNKDAISGDLQISSNPQASKPKKAPTIQFLDLGSKSPYISYQGQVFTGSWGENIGTDLILASTSDVPKDATPVFKARDGKWSLLGLSRTTLVAKPVELVKRSRLEIQPSTSTAATATVATQNDVSSEAPKPRKPFSICLANDADPKQRRQAAYLEQLQAVKFARGENDIVYLGKSMKYIDSEGKLKRAPGFKKRDWMKMNEGSVTKSRAKKRVPSAADENDVDGEERSNDGSYRGSDAEVDEVLDDDTMIDPDLENEMQDPVAADDDQTGIER